MLPAKLGKDPHVETGYLPDKDREAHEAQLREQLKKEYELRQQVGLLHSSYHPLLVLLLIASID